MMERNKALEGLGRMGARGFIFFIRNYYGRIKFNYNNMNGLNRN